MNIGGYTVESVVSESPTALVYKVLTSKVTVCACVQGSAADCTRYT